MVSARLPLRSPFWVDLATMNASPPHTFQTPRHLSIGSHASDWKRTHRASLSPGTKLDSLSIRCLSNYLL